MTRDDDRLEVADLSARRRARSGDAAPRDGGHAFGVFADILRNSLAVGSDREVLDPMVGRLAAELGLEAVAVAKHDGEVTLDLIAAHGWPEGGPTGNRLGIEDGLTGEAFRTGRPVRSDDTRRDPRFVDASDGVHRSALAVPMRLATRVWGVLVVESAEPAAYSDRDVELLQPIADMMGWAFESFRLRRETDERAAREARLSRGLEASAVVITAGLEATDTDVALDRMTREVRDGLSWDAVAVVMRRDGALECVSEYGCEGVRGQRVPEDRGILGHVALTGRAYLAANVFDDPHYIPLVPGTISEMCAPLTISGRVVGLLNVESRTSRFDEVDLEVLSRLADQLSLVLHNTELLSSEKDTVARLHELDRLKSRLLTIASHELRTPLTVVMGFAEVLAEHVDQLEPQKAKDYAVAIARQAGSLSRLVDQMLVAAQIEQGLLSVTPTPVELLPVVAKALKGREQHIEVLPGTGDVTVLADPFRLAQVLENLFDNAIKYASEAGRIQIDARPVGDEVVILVRDEGPGIPADEQENVFQAFHQVGEHGVAGRRGVGLGLAVARDLVRLMSGDLALVSAEGYGATFTLRLPAAGES